MNTKLKAILSGIATYFPRHSGIAETGGANRARYCYAVWLRHLVKSWEATSSPAIPQVLAELGPGASIGVGLAALLCGVERYYAVDAVNFVDRQKNQEILDELITLFLSRAPIPKDDEFPNLSPRLQDYTFPQHILSEELLSVALANNRIEVISRSIAEPNTKDSVIHYVAPWTNKEIISPQSIDMVLSQAVLEHVDDLSLTYEAMKSWLKPTGVTSHQIDFKCHGKAEVWNGHWTYSDLEWKVIVGTRPFLINREPLSTHLNILRQTGFEVIGTMPLHSPNTLERKRLAPRYRALSDSDLSTSGVYLIAKPVNL